MRFFSLNSSKIKLEVSLKLNISIIQINITILANKIKSH